MYINGKTEFEEVYVKYKSKTKNKIVKESEIMSWPGVKSGYLTKNEALEMFNKYFE